MKKYNITIHDKPLEQTVYNSDEKTNDKTDQYINNLDIGNNFDGGDYDDFDVEVKMYVKPVPFREFILYPFKGLTNYKPIFCKTGQILLPKEIIELYSLWNFENYHQMELISLLYLHYFRNTNEWTNQVTLQKEIDSILEALPHFKSITELFTFAYANGDIKSNHFDTLIEIDDSGVHDITGTNIDTGNNNE